MFKNDFGKKTALFLTLMLFMLLLLMSCEKRDTLTGSAYDVARHIYDVADGEGGELFHEKINADGAYEIGLTPEEFQNTVEEARLFKRSEFSGGKSMAVIVAKDEMVAGKLFDKLYNTYEFAPCDPCDKAAFLQSGRYILIAKDDEDDTERLCSAFSFICGGHMRVKTKDNPM